MLAPEVRIDLLGGFRVWVGERAVPAPAWRLRRAAGAVQLLALAPHLRLHREEVVERLWPEADPESAFNSLHQVLRAARRALEPDLGRERQSAYLRLHSDVLSLPPATVVDVTQFEDAAAAARQRRDEATCEAAIRRYTGDLLPDDPYAGWTEPRRSRLREACALLLLELAQLREARGEAAGAIEALQRQVVMDPVGEAAHVGLMRLFAGHGERGRALRQYAVLGETLRRELDVAPGPEAQALYRSIVSQVAPSTSPVPRADAAVGLAAPSVRQEEPAWPRDGGRRTNLPLPLTSFVGRAKEVAAVERLLVTGSGEGRLLTLSGPGGAGKSRLALEVGRRIARVESAARPEGSSFRDGVWHVDLEGVAGVDDDRLAHRAAAAVGLPAPEEEAPAEALARALESRTLLLIFDGCEHVTRAAAALVTRLLRRCAGVYVLATSREPLRVPGERVWSVPPLALPAAVGVLAGDECEDHDAVRLFAERARQARPDFVLSPQRARTVAEVCRRLDGLPLAIELAAARTRVLTVEQILERLDARFDLLCGGAAVPARHQTLLAAMDWSHSLLSEPERVLFRRLAAFERGWVLDEAEAVCAGDGLARSRVLDLLSQLVDKSLVVAEPHPAGATYFRMLETVREYAWGELVASGELDAVRRRLAAGA